MKRFKELTGSLIFLILSFFIVSTYAATFEKTGKKVDDAVIVAKIKLLYTKDSGLNPLSINVSSKAGMVSLKGEVNTDQQYEKAVMLADAVKGVKDINADALKVKDSKQPLKDTYITAKIKGNLIKNKILALKNVKYWTVNIETKNGVVYLSGKVDNQQQKNNIISIVRSVKDVKSVQSSELVVK